LYSYNHLLQSQDSFSPQNRDNEALAHRQYSIAASLLIGFGHPAPQREAASYDEVLLCPNTGTEA
jgi:hypothetical protein